MRKHVRQLLYEAERAGEACGVSVRLLTGRGHHSLKLELVGRGTRRIKPIATTPSDADISLRKGMADVRRLLREMTA